MQAIHNHPTAINEEDIGDRCDSISLAEIRVLVQIHVDHCNLGKHLGDIRISKRLFLESLTWSAPSCPKINHHWSLRFSRFLKRRAEKFWSILGQFRFDRRCSLHRLGGWDGLGGFDDLRFVANVSDRLRQLVLGSQRRIIGDRYEILGVIPCDFLGGVSPFQGLGDRIRSPQSRSA